MSLSFTTANAVLKEDYKDLVEQLNDKFFLLAQIEKDTENTDGKRAFHALHTSRSGGVGSRSTASAGGVLPTARSQGYANIVVPLRWHYGRIQVDGPVIKAMLRDETSFTRAIKSEMDRIQNDVSRDLNRQVWGTSDGVIAATGVTDAATTVVLASATTITQLRQLWDDGGMYVDIGTVADPTAVASARKVTAFDATNKTITISGAAVTTTADHRVFRSGNGGASAATGLVDDGQKELTGLQSIISASAALFGLDPATTPVWAANEFGAGSGRNVSTDLINEAIQDTEIVSGGHVDLLMCNAPVHRAIANLFTSERRQVNTVSLKGGYSGIEWSVAGEFDNSATTRVIKLERDAPNNALYGVSSQDLVTYAATSSFEWMEDDGAVLNRVPNADAYEATLFNYMELAAKRRNTHFVLSDLNE